MDNKNTNYQNSKNKLGAIKFFLFIAIGYLCLIQYQNNYNKNISP